MTDTRQSRIEESIATENERDELRRRIDAALVVCEDPDTYPDEDAALDLVASILRGDDEPRYATAEELRNDADVDRLVALTRRLDQQRAILMRHETRLADLERPSGAQSFDPAKHSDKRGTVIGRG